MRFFTKAPLPLLFFFMVIHASSAQVGIGTFDPKDDSVLDIQSTTKGLLIPRVSLTNLSLLSPVTGSVSGSEGLLVYNKNTVTGKGFYFWNGVNSWIPMAGSNNKGLKYYSYNITPSNPPNLNNINVLEVVDKNGVYNGNLQVTNSQFPSSVLKPSNNEGFAIRLVGFYTVKNTGVFNFTTTSDDGSRIYIDGALVLDQWWDSSGNSSSGSVTLSKGKHKIEFWYYENAGDQSFRFQWGTNPDGLPLGTISANQFSID